MKKKYLKELCAAAVTAIVLSPCSAVLAEDDFDIHGSATIGFKELETDGDGEKFEQYRDVPDEDFVLEEVEIYGELRDWFFDLKGRDFSQDDQYFRAEGGRWGKYKVRILWDEIPHNFHDGVFLGSEIAPGFWAVPDITQQTLQADFPLGGNPPLEPTAAGLANLQDLIDHADSVDLEIDRQRGEIGFVYTLIENFNIRANYMHQSRDGFRAMSSGAYRRDSDGAELFGGVGENFTLYGLEFPEPIDYETDEVTLGLDYRQDFWHVDFTYQYTSFENNIGAVTWDNPLLFDTGLFPTGNSFEVFQGGSNINRLDLYPDSTSHALNLSGGLLNLPLNSTLTATVAWDRVTQDDPFLAYTVNRALVDSVTGEVIADKALPVNDLDGEVTTTLFNAVLNSRPLDPLSVDLKFNYYDYENDSQVITWPGWVGIAETTWYSFPGGNTKNHSAENPTHRNRVPAFERTRAGIDASYKVNPLLTLLADYLYEKYDRNEDRNADTEENIFGGGVQLFPADWANLRLNYHYADRDIDGEYTSTIARLSEEWEELRMFDQAERERNVIDAYLSLTPTEKLSLGGSLKYTDDEYDEEFYGLLESDGYSAGIDLNYMFTERLTLFAYYVRDDWESRQRNRTKSDATGGGSFAVPQNDWITDLEDVADTVGGGFLVALIPAKLTLGVSADYSNAESEFDTSNPNFVAGVTTSGATAQAWPDVESETTEVKVDLNYSWTENWGTGLHYLYSRFDLDDFATDLVEPFGIPEDFMGNDLSHFIFMDANFTDYEAHLVSATLTYSF